MSNTYAFAPNTEYPSVNLAVSAVSANAVVTGQNNNNGALMAVRVKNDGPNDCFINTSPSGVATGSLITGMKVGANTIEVFNFQHSAGVVNIGAICATSQTAQLNFTPGYGM